MPRVHNDNDHNDDKDDGNVTHLGRSADLKQRGLKIGENNTWNCDYSH